MGIKEIYKRYPSEWVLIEDPVSDKQLRPLRGKVVLHSKDPAEFDRRSIELKPRHAAVVYTGKPPANMEFVL